MLKKYIAVILSLLTCCSLFGCQKSYPAFVTEYTAEEHLQRIKTRTEERFAEELADGEILSYHVEIVYSFYTYDPEYFLVELEYADEWTDKCNVCGVEYTTKYKHLIGIIKKDEYKCGAFSFRGGFVDGKSAYTASGYANARKVFAFGFYAVDTEQGTLSIYACLGDRDRDTCYLVGAKEWDVAPELITNKMQKSLLIDSRTNHDLVHGRENY